MYNKSCYQFRERFTVLYTTFKYRNPSVDNSVAHMPINMTTQGGGRGEFTTAPMAMPPASMEL